MMSTRRAKQLVYGALYALIVLLFCAVIYFIFINPIIVASTPVPCAPDACAPTSTAPIAVGTVNTFMTSSGHYTFLTQATDQDPNYGALAFSYEIDLEDASGTVVQSIPGDSFIYPSQSKYLLAPNQVVSQPFVNAVLSVTAATWISSSTIGPIAGVPGSQFALQNIQTGVASTTVSVGGQLVNTGVATYGQVVIVVVFNDQGGDSIGASETELANVGPGTTNNFSVIYPNVASVNPASPTNQILVYALR